MVQFQKPTELANTTSSLNRRRKWLVVVPLGLVAGLAALFLRFSWVTFVDSAPLFRGKPESVWLKNLKYWDDDQVREWRGYGEQGVQVLIRGLQHANYPGERAYRAVYRRLPGFVMRWVPNPKNDSTRAARMCLTSLLSSLGNDAKSATPIMIRTLNNDEDDSVRQCTINFFTTSEDEKCWLNQMPPRDKKKLLPGLSRALQDGRNWGLRNNAANALKWFPEEKKALAPVLVKALQDPQPQVRLLVAEALNRVDPEAAKKAGAVAIVLGASKDPDPQVASRAISALRYFKNEPESAVPALVVLLENTNTLVACEAVWILEGSGREFGNYSNTIVSALTKATQRTDNAGKYARRALQRFQLESDPSQGSNSVIQVCGVKKRLSSRVAVEDLPLR